MANKEHPLAKYVVEGYEPHFPRLSVERRVLGHITDEDHVGRGPRNTVERLEQELAEDPNTPPLNVGKTVDKLVDAELVKRSSDGKLSLTKAGITELVN